MASTQFSDTPEPVWRGGYPDIACNIQYTDWAVDLIYTEPKHLGRSRPPLSGLQTSAPRSDCLFNFCIVIKVHPHLHHAYFPTVFLYIQYTVECRCPHSPTAVVSLLIDPFSRPCHPTLLPYVPCVLSHLTSSPPLTLRSCPCIAITLRPCISLTWRPCISLIQRPCTISLSPGVLVAVSSNVLVHIYLTWRPCSSLWRCSSRQSWQHSRQSRSPRESWSRF